MARRTTLPADGWWAEHPRAVLLVRAGLYLAAAATLGALVAATLGVLGVLAAFAGVAALVGAGAIPGAVPLGLGGLAVALSLTAGMVVVVGVRRLDARVAAAAERPDPVDRLQDRYVNADIDEVEFERRLERLLGTPDAGEAGSESPRAAAGSEPRHASAERSRESERA